MTPFVSILLSLVLGVAAAAALAPWLARRRIQRLFREGLEGEPEVGRALDLRLQEAERAHQRRLRSIVETALDAVVTVDRQGRVMEWNRRAEEMFGWRRNEIMGRQLADFLVPPEDQEGWATAFRAWAGSGDLRPLRQRMEAQALRRTGERFPVELAVAPLDEPGEEGGYLSAFVRDVTLRRSTEEALRRSEERFRRLVETADIVPWEADSATTRITYVGPQAETLLGHPVEVWHEEGFWIRHVHPEDREHALRSLAEAAEGGGRSTTFEYRMVHRDGQEVWVRDLVTSEVEGGRVVLRGFRFDVTERRRLEQELLQAGKLEAVGRLAGGIAHDFNNIVTAILGYTDLIGTALPPDSELQAEVREVRRAAGHAADLTQDLLAFARKQVIRPEDVELDGQLDSLRRMLTRLIGEDVQIDVRTGASGAVVRVDPGRLEQAVMNLALNARDAMPRGGVLTLSTEVVRVDAERPGSDGVAGEYVVLSVEDTGVGMEPETLDRVFEPFFTTKKKGKGTGLGLSSAYGVVKQAGGFIDVDSVPGRGSRFSVHLPRVEVDAAALREETAAPLDEAATRPRRGGTVLIAEDDDALRALGRRTLEAEGYRVLTATNGREAVEESRAQEGAIDLLLADVVMPGMGGLQAADVIRSERPGIQVLFVSGYAEETLFAGGVEDGEGVAFLAKPFSPEALGRTVRALLGPAVD